MGRTPRGSPSGGVMTAVSRPDDIVQRNGHGVRSARLSPVLSDATVLDGPTSGTRGRVERAATTPIRVREKTMKNTVPAAVALPTALVIALAGLLTAVPAASAAPVEQSQGGAVPVEQATPAPEPVVDEAGPVDGDAGSSEEAVAPVAPSTSSPDEATAPTTPGAPEAATAEIAAAPAFDVTSPLQGQELRSAGVRVEGTAPVGSRVSVSHDGGSQISTTGSDGAFSTAVWLEAPSTPATYVVSVQVTGADGADLGTVERTVTVAALPVSAAPVITSPLSGNVVGEPDDPQIATVRLEGTGTPGATVDIDLEPVGPPVPWGYDDAPPVVRADGTWSDSVFLPYGPWRVSASQSSVDADGFETARPSSRVSVVLDVLRAPSAPAAAPVVTSPAPGSTVVGRPDRSRGAEASSLEFTVSGTGTPGTAIGIYGYFTEGRAPIDRYVAASRGEGSIGGEFEPLVAGVDPVVVAADGTWTTTQSLVGPGTYSFAAFTLTGDPFYSTMSDPSQVVTFSLVAPTRAATTASLAYTGDDGVGPALAGAVLAIGLGLLSVAGARLVRRRVRPAALRDAAAGSARRA